MPFTSFGNDVFISYAQVDNLEEPRIDGSRWVTNLRDALQKGLDERLGGVGVAQIWMDLQAVQGNDLVTPEIRTAAMSSAALVVVLTTNSCDRPWCRQEREHFVAAASSLAALAGRIFVVLPHELPMERWPEAFRDRIGYKFYLKSSDGEIVRLGWPKPTVEQKEYFAVLEKLRRELAEQLRKMRGAAGSSGGKGDSGTGGGPGRSNGHVDTVAGATSQEKVFLAEVVSDLEQDRDRLAEALRGAGYAILPDRFYSRAPDEFREQMAHDLPGCVLYLHLLGSRSTRAGDNLTYDGLQAATARAAFADRADRLVFWRSPAVEIDKAKFEDHGQLLKDPQTKVMDLEELKSCTLTLLQRFRDRVQRPPDSNRLVLINAAREDQVLAERLAREATRSDLDSDVIWEDKSVVDVARASDEVSGLMVVYGKNHDDWVSDQVRKMRSLVLERKTNAPRCAVYVGPPEDRNLLCQFRQLVRISDQPALARFLADVAGKGARP
jgi:hypothetical protein